MEVRAHRSASRAIACSFASRCRDRGCTSRASSRIACPISIGCSHRSRNIRSCEITTIGKTVAGRDLEIVRIGDPAAPYRVFLRARAHPWEPGSNWVVQGLIQRLLKDDAEARRFLQLYSV